MNELSPTTKDSLVVNVTERRLTAAEFHRLAEVPAAAEWLGHAIIGTTHLYDRRQTRPEDSPTYRVRY